MWQIFEYSKYSTVIISHKNHSHWWRREYVTAICDKFCFVTGGSLPPPRAWKLFNITIYWLSLMYSAPAVLLLSCSNRAAHCPITVLTRPADSLADNLKGPPIPVFSLLFLSFPLPLLCSSSFCVCQEWVKRNERAVVSVSTRVAPLRCFLFLPGDGSATVSATVPLR